MKRTLFFAGVVSTALLAGCVSPNQYAAQQIIPASEMTAPEPIYGNTGKYLSPFTEDNTVAPWVEKGMSAAAAASVGGALGSYAGQKALEQVPFIGGMLGNAAGKAAGREIAINAAGGWEFIKESSDLSFDSLEALARYIYVNNSTHPQYAEVLKATYGIYPELQQTMAVTLSRR